ncbi:D-isomer specific 2-hydroxyacid dehydrogenase, catalytic domain [Palleronia marisminoris]|uniref:Glyoxylate/hydroxypyruvate reductase B n=1 Tax=Palleronia marisminoris TaxID=315423 RepID=A0A1Y5S0E9_9RHOB|nr:2-hydroxyacid dehydrogenase [Palleronia marisminoris]SFG38991.1 D-isomer specific 2-hydroxyacid dehydrogenase, catalytic domain [Palleronia marisminoris]SLN29605.1 Glyoxylate/hydroxypyruvate reductase B [Palleronia marisminoris]
MSGPVVAVLEPASDEMRARMETLCPDFDLRFAASGDPADFAEALGEARYAVTRGLRFPAAALDDAPKLELIHQWGTGTDGIPIEAARLRGITIARSPGVNAPTVAEATVALMLATLRRLPQVHASLRSGQWEQPDLWREARDLGSLTVGLVGMGAIGTEVAKRLDGFGCAVIYTRASGPMADCALRFAPLDALVAECDVISLHLPLTDTTRAMIDADALASMKQGAVLINTSRGGLVHEAALVAALVSGHLSGAGLDVFSSEPVSADNPLLSMPQVVTLPHVAGRTLDNFDRMVSHWADNIRAHAAGRQIAPECLVSA